MMQLQIESDAFDEALLRSERIRTASVLFAIVAILFVGFIYSVLSGLTVTRPLPAIALLVTIFGLFESFHLLAIQRALAGAYHIPASIWTLTTIAETQLPTVSLWLLTKSTLMGPYTALMAPVALMYFVFILLSVLRLRPVLCLLTGMLSALGYCAVAVSTVWRSPDGSGQFPFPFGGYVAMYASVLLVSGFLAAGITRSIHKYVLAALREAEARRLVERMEHDLEIARSIQQGLLPKEPPKIDGFEIAGWNQPADEIGGDYFDWQTLPDGRAAISLADVSGHGIGPALVAAQCRAFARAIVPTAAGLGEAITQINRLISQDLSVGRFVTYVMAILTPSSSRVQLLSAGHGPLLLYTAADQAVRSFNAHAIPLGIGSHIDYGSPQDIDLEPGDLLLLVTDGFFEWANDEGEFFGIERVIECVRAHASLPARELIRKLYSLVVEFAGRTLQADDLTAVFVRRTVT